MPTPLESSMFVLPQRLAGKADLRFTARDEQQFAAIEAAIGQQREEIAGRLNARRKATARFGGEVVERDQEIRRLSSQLAFLQRFGVDLCLGRMVMEAQADPMYIGRAGLRSSTGEQLLIDWRAPAARPFFSATRADPMGLASRRRYRWNNGKVTDYWDEVFVAGFLCDATTYDDESAFIMSLTENIARRKFSPLELLVGIEQLRDQGYDKKDIAQKTGLSPEYVQGILYLLKNGEERLLMAVGSGRIPLNAAITIAGAGTDDKAIQAALQDAYESGKLRGSQLIQARRVIERRRTQGRAVGGKMSSRKPNADVTTSSLVRNYQREVERQKQLVRKAETAQRNLLFIVGALRQLLADENFTNLLRAEGMDSLPQYLADRVWARGCGS